MRQKAQLYGKRRQGLRVKKGLLIQVNYGECTLGHWKGGLLAQMD